MPVKFTYERHTDVMYADYGTPPEGAVIDVEEIGEKVGFPGQVYLRTDHVTGEVYGATVENYSGMARALHYRQKMFRTKKYLEVLLSGVRAGLYAGSHRPSMVA